MQIRLACVSNGMGNFAMDFVKMITVTIRARAILTEFFAREK